MTFGSTQLAGVPTPGSRHGTPRTVDRVEQTWLGAAPANPGGNRKPQGGPRPAAGGHPTARGAGQQAGPDQETARRPPRRLGFPQPTGGRPSRGQPNRNRRPKRRTSASSTGPGPAGSQAQIAVHVRRRASPGGRPRPDRDPPVGTHLGVVAPLDAATGWRPAGCPGIGPAISAAPSLGQVDPSSKLGGTAEHLAQFRRRR